MVNMRIAVLGATGYLGSLVTQYLSNKKSYSVISVTRSDLNLEDFHSVRNWLIETKPHAIVNCAVAGGQLTVNDINYPDLQNNLNIFLNFYNNSDLFERFINIGSGSEFNARLSIDNAKEEDIFTSAPLETYAYSKNVISRLAFEKDKFYTLRLFGCFDKSEPNFRLLKKFIKSDSFEFQNRKFDYISSKDFLIILEHYLTSQDILYKDINCVYNNKVWLSDILETFKRLHRIPNTLKITGINILNYTGSSSKLDLLDLNLNGLEKSLRLYFE